MGGTAKRTGVAARLICTLTVLALPGFCACYNDHPSDELNFLCDLDPNSCPPGEVCVQAGAHKVCSSKTGCPGGCSESNACVDGVCKCFKLDCTGRECGDDLCGGTCGSCESGERCNDGTCEDDCGTWECGVSEHGVSCGSCPEGDNWSCIEGQCEDDCAGRECGESPVLGVICGSCPLADRWSCIEGQCEDDCVGRECGESPALGAFCGSCPSGDNWSCIEGQCEDDCVGRECGLSPTLGASCGSCPEGDNWSCNDGQCEDDCAGRECGVSPVLGVSCGSSCLWPNWCNDGTCKNECINRECGFSEHGITCGYCSSREWCNAGQCEDDCAGRECGLSPLLSVNCGTCDGTDFCAEGQCVWQVGEYTVNCGADNMCFVPEGSFWMGCNETVDDDCDSGEWPYHEVTLSGYYIDRTEVTVAAYRDCVTTGSCTAPSTEIDCNWGVGGRDGHPVNCVDWTQADEYCAWAGKRLPTEAEWEKAARGTDGRKYPWGNEIATCNFAVMDDGVDGCGTDSTWYVCSRSPAGDSPYGLCDMSGNVWEWVADWWDLEYYADSPPSNPTGPVSGLCPVRRGGGLGGHGNDGSLRVSLRGGPYAIYDDRLGFRCVRSEVSEEVCDGIDNDIDGLTDDEVFRDWDGSLKGVFEPCGTGACFGGHVECPLDGSNADCDTSHLSSIELLNGIDDDCDGMTDDNYCTPDCTGLECGLDSVCEASCGMCDGTDVCVGGQCIFWQSGEYTVNCGADAMCFVPAGPFHMGCAAVDEDCDPDESPYHELTLSGYYIDTTEVTVDAYGECVTAGSCTAPTTGSSCNWGVGGRGGNPVNCVSWDQGSAYCTWVGKRLPTEAEWEKAARGTDGRKYPWGNEDATCEYAVMYEGGSGGCGTGGTMDVCDKSPMGDSPFGLCDMSGNVWEWVSDWYADIYYSSSPTSNPTGPVSGSYRIFRGGGFGSDGVSQYSRASNRHYESQSYSHDALGFRCVRSEVSYEDCDGIDNDIDGLTDEDIPGVPTSCGYGACANIGQLQCISGSWSDSCDPGSPGQDEDCFDGLDNDCDSFTDCEDEECGGC